jgi:hypothetical protein
VSSPVVATMKAAVFTLELVVHVVVGTLFWLAVVL